MFRKVLGYAAFAVGGIFAAKFMFGILGFLVMTLVKLAVLAVLALGLYAVLKVFVPSLFGSEAAAGHDEEIVVEEVDEVEVEQPVDDKGEGAE